jgi:hypothetical protein
VFPLLCELKMGIVLLSSGSSSGQLFISLWDFAKPKRGGKKFEMKHEEPSLLGNYPRQ